MNTSAKGELSEAKVTAALLHRGVSISIPWGNSQAYDLIVDLNGELLRVQVKTGHRVGDVIAFNCHTQKRDKSRVGYLGSADFYAVYFPPDEGVYMVPVGACGDGMASLRILPAKNGQTKKIRLADGCHIDTWLGEQRENLVGAGGLEPPAFTVSR